MNLRTLWYFLSVASAGGVSAGARRLGLAQSTLSGVLGTLETEIGASLFEATPIGSRLTPAGIRLRDYAVWLALEAEQAFLDLYAGSIAPTETVPVVLSGVPRGSVTDWAMMNAAFANAQRGGRRATLVASDDGLPDEAHGPTFTLRYQLAPKNEISQPAGPVRVTDNWRLLTLRETDDDRPLDWDALSRLRLIVPLLAVSPDERSAAFVDLPTPETAALDPAGAPFTVIDRKDAALLLPSTCMPAGYTSAGLQLRSVTNAPVVPVIELDAGHSATDTAFLHIVADALEQAVSAGDSKPKRFRSLAAHVDLHTLRCFAATMETGNTARAAESCYIVQPALSGQIRKLEKALSRKLFSRSNTGMNPTEAARRLYGFTAPILNDHQTALERLRDTTNGAASGGRVRIGLIPAANENSLIAEAAADALTEWRHDHPATPISVAEGYTSVLTRWLRTHLIDLAVIDTTESQPGLKIMPILREPITLILAPQSPWDTGEDEISGVKLADVPLVMPSPRFGLRALTERALAGSNARIAPDMEVDSLAIALRLVRTGQWATILPPSAVHRQLSEGVLKRRLLVDPDVERRICAAVRTGSKLSEEAKALLAHLNACFHARLSDSE